MKIGDFLTTTFKSGQQWDAPNGWTPIQHIAVKPLEITDIINWLMRCEIYGFS
nr:trehalase family glycosidase [Bacteroidetes bacterium endosymbiont of Geopemphigus sp.]